MTVESGFTLKGRPTSAGINLFAKAIFILALPALALTRKFHDDTRLDQFLSISMGSMFVVCLHLLPIGDLVYILLITGGLASLQMVLLHVGLEWMPLLALLGISSLVVLGVSRARSTGKRRDLLRVVYLSLLGSLFVAYLRSAALSLAGEMQHRTFDLPLYCFDGSLGTQLSFQVGKLLLRHRGLEQVARVSYLLLPVPLMLVYAQQIQRQGIRSWRVLAAFALAGPLGIVFYSFFPACGPFYLAGPLFPLLQPTIEQAGAMLRQHAGLLAVPNAFPSLHMAWALLGWWYSRRLALWVRSFLSLYVALTVLATLGLGEHYFVDLVAAFPFALMVEALFALDIPLGSARRAIPLAAGLAMLLAWIALLRFAWPLPLVSPRIPWALLISTVLLCVMLEARLHSVESLAEAT